MNENVPDAKTIWFFRETLMKKGVLEELYTQLNKTMQTLGLILNKGRIIDATIMEVPKQRNTRQENKQIKEGQIPKEWKAEKVKQKDVDASWLTKDGKDYFGFKNHVVIDRETKLIVDFQVTLASVKDREIGEELIEEISEGSIVYADRGYPSKRLSEKMKSRGITDKVMRKGSRNKAISQSEKERNKEISRTRCKIEQVFGFMKRHGKKFDIRCNSQDYI